jgi:hypothetical protein
MEAVSMGEVYLEVHASALRERAAAVRSCGNDLDQHAEALTARVPLPTYGPWAGTVVAPSSALTESLGDVVSALSGGLHAVQRESKVLARAMALAADRYQRTDVLPGTSR